MIYSIKEGSIKLADTQLDYIAFGRGIKPLIMIQGLNTRGIKGAGVSLAFMYRIFAKEYRVYLFDRRSDVPMGVTVRDFAADTAGAMDKLGLKDACVLGVSQGGMIAQYLAIDRPDLVGRLVLAVTASRNNKTMTDTVNGWIEMTKQNSFRALVEDMAVKMYSPQYVKRYRPFMPLLTLLQKPKDAARFITLSQSCLTCDTYTQLDKIKCPVLVVGGRQDKVVDVKASEEIAHKLGCEMFIYENLGHAAYEEAKDFNKRVYDFLAGSHNKDGK